MNETNVTEQSERGYTTSRKTCVAKGHTILARKIVCRVLSAVLRALDRRQEGAPNFGPQIAPRAIMARSSLGCTLLFLATTGALRPLNLRRTSAARTFPQPRMSDEAPDSGRRSLLGLNRPDSIKVGDEIIAGNDYNSSSPAFGVIRFQAYKLQRVYYQGVRDGLVERVDVESLEAKPPSGCAGYTKYMCLYSSKYHAASGPVVLSPTEVEVVRMKDEIADSAWLALPGLFWVWLAYTFWRYGEDNGGAFRGLEKPTAKPTVASDELAAALSTLAAD